MKTDANKYVLYLGLAFSVITAIVLNRTIGFLFIGMYIAYFLASLKKDVFPITSGSINYRNMLVLMVAGFAGFVVLGSFISGQPFNLQSVFRLYGTQALAQLSINNPVVKYIIWGVYIPLAETLFFLGFIGSIVAGRLRVVDRGVSLKGVYTSLIVGAIAAVSHIISQGVIDSFLLLDIVFFGISMMLALYDRTLEAPLFLHIIINSGKLVLGGV